VYVVSGFSRTVISFGVTVRLKADTTYRLGDFSSTPLCLQCPLC
jgi:hypothetical protein